jgi:serine protease Do
LVDQSLSAAGRTITAVGIASILTLAIVDDAEAHTAPESFAGLVEELSPAVVNISTSQNVEQRTRRDFPMPDLPPGSPFEEFFKEFFDERSQRGPRKQTALGSGFVIDPEGIVVTNNHVIDEADEIKVIFDDGTELEAEIIGRDEKTDLALLQVKSNKTLPFVPFGNSDAVRVGDWVMAIGNPLGFGGTVTAGIVSARNRNIDAGPYDDFIQTDASINKGNSGGPLFNMDGQVVGINTAIVSPTGGSIGIGFAVPANIAQSVILQLQEYGETRRGWLGVRIQSMTPEIAESMDLDKAMGALVAGVDEEGPAAEAGIEVGDLIVKFDGKEVPAMRDLPRMVAETEIGRKVDVEVLRKGARKALQVDIARLDENQTVAIVGDGEGGKSGSESSILGLTMSMITPKLREEYGLADDINGVVVIDIDFKSDAIDKIRKGDVIVEVDQEPVATPKDVIERVDKLMANSSKPILLLLNRAGELTFLSVRPQES